MDKQIAPSFEERLMNYSETVGRLLGMAEGHAENLLDRARVAENLARIRDGASELLSHLGSASKESEKGKGAGKPDAAQAKARSRGVVDAPGKKHRRPPPSVKGAKHSDQRIARANAAAAARRGRPRQG